MDNKIVSLTLPNKQRLRFDFHEAVLRHPLNIQSSTSSIKYPGVSSEIPEDKIIKDLNKLCCLFKPTEPSIFALDDKGETLMHCAAAQDMPDLISMLHELKFDVNAQSPHGFTPLLVAALNNRLDTCKSLIELGANLNYAAPGGWTAVSIAILNDFEPLTSFLLGQGADLDSRDVDGNSHAFYLAQDGDTYGISKLLKCGLSIHQVNSRHESLIWIACFSRKLEAIQHLQQMGANINDTNIYKYSALHSAVISLEETLIHHLCQLGADLESRDQFKETPICHSVRAGSMSITQTLLELTADITVVNQDQDNLLHMAAFNGHDEMISFLVKNGLDINSRNGIRQTPLLHAVNQKKVSSIQLLADLGADLHVTDEYSHSAYSYALVHNDEDTIAVLEDLGLNQKSSDSQNNNQEYTVDILEALELQLPQRATRLFFLLDESTQYTLAGDIITHLNGDKTTLFDFTLQQIVSDKNTMNTKDAYRFFLGYIANSNDFFATLKFQTQAQALRTTMDYFQLDEYSFMPS